MRIPDGNAARTFSATPPAIPGNNVSPIYKVRHMSSRVTSITESDNYGQTPHMYIIRGEDMIVLVDTGVGTGDLRSFIQVSTSSLYSPALFICAHFHTHAF